MSLITKKAEEEYNQVGGSGSYEGNERIEIEKGGAVVGIAKELRYVEAGERKFIVLTIADDENNLYDITGWLTTDLTNEEGKKVVSPFGPGMKDVFATEIDGEIALKPELVDVKMEIARKGNVAEKSGRTYYTCEMSIIE